MVINTDFTHEEDFALAPEGIQKVEVENVYEKDASTGKRMVVFELRAENGGKLFHNCMNEEGIRWMLKKMLHAITGIKPPKGPVKIYEDDLIGKEIEIEVYHDDWNGTARAKVKDVVVPAEEEPLEEEEEERPATKKKTKVPF